MPKRTALIMATLFAINPALATETHREHVHASPYAGEKTREIKALSQADVDELLRGGGWGLAKAAELNGMPGPSHVLDMASELGLSAEQVERTRKIGDAMRREAKTIGERFVAKEAALETRFRAGDIVQPELAARISEIEALRAKLRTAHLSAHIEMKRVLSAHQIERYATLRGYR
jgi:Spy/CpxP family protein refolding chaperone